MEKEILFLDARKVFDKAVKDKFLSGNKNMSHYAGNYAYMGSEKAENGYSHEFKCMTTRQSYYFTHDGDL